MMNPRAWFELVPNQDTINSGWVLDAPGMGAGMSVEVEGKRGEEDKISVLTATVRHRDHLHAK